MSSIGVRQDGGRGLLRRFLAEPLVQFLLLGAALFAIYAWRSGAVGGRGAVVLKPGQIDHLAAGFQRTWQRPPDETELKGLIDDWVRDEIATREAMALGLDRDDTVLRRRLRQKLEFLLESGASAAPPSDAELEARLAAHPADYRIPPRLGLAQIFLDPSRRGEAVERDAARLLDELRRANRSPEAAELLELGDTTLLPREIELRDLDLVARELGEEVAAAAAKAEVGRWSGPVASGFGLHLLFVRERVEGRPATLAERRAEVERDVVEARRKAALEAMYARLLAKYPVVIERRGESSTAGGG